MMDSVILKTAIRFLLPLLLLSSIFLFLRGHNEPGGGFVGGLVLGGTIALYALIYGTTEARNLVRLSPRVLIGSGLLISLGSGVAPLLTGRPFLTGLWTTADIIGIEGIHFGTPLLFDLGVYFVVTGVTLVFIFTLLDE